MSRLSLPEPRMRALWVGKPGTGKSTDLKRHLSEWSKRGVRIVALDPCDEYSREGNDTALVQLGGLKRRVTAEELAREPQLLNEKRLSLAVVTGEHPRDAAAGFLLLSRLVRAWKKHVLVVADEVGLWTDAKASPQCVAAEAELKALAVGGRKHGIALALVAQRAAQVVKTVRSACTEIHAFYQDEPGDLEALAERTRQPDWAAQVGQLPPFRKLVWSDSQNRADPTADATPVISAVEIQ